MKKSTFTLLTKIHHELTTIDKLYVSDGVNLAETWQLDLSDLISKIENIQEKFNELDDKHNLHFL